MDQGTFLGKYLGYDLDMAQITYYCRPYDWWNKHPAIPDIWQFSKQCQENNATNVKGRLKLCYFESTNMHGGSLCGAVRCTWPLYDRNSVRFSMFLPYPIGSMVLLYMVTFTINIPPMLAYIPYMDPMGMFYWLKDSSPKDMQKPVQSWAALGFTDSAEIGRGLLRPTFLQNAAVLPPFCFANGLWADQGTGEVFVPFL